jgi:F-type H+-transporting ATPase subunit epsilon
LRRSNRTDGYISVESLESLTVDKSHMANTIRLEIATPEAMVYSEDVDMVTLPGVEGQMGVLPQHVRLITLLVPGELIVHQSGHDDFMAVGEGLVEVTNERVSIVTNMAVAVDKIDEAAVEEARQRAASRLREKISSEEVASVNASLARSLAQLNVKRRHR